MGGVSLACPHLPSSLSMLPPSLSLFTAPRISGRPRQQRTRRASSTGDRDFDIGGVSLVGGTVRSYAQPQFGQPTRWRLRSQKRYVAS